MKKMGRKFLAGTAMTVTALSLTGCLFPQPSVYGPPPSQPDPAVESTDIDVETDFDVETEIPVDVYGPPGSF